MTKTSKKVYRSSPSKQNRINGHSSFSSAAASALSLSPVAEDDEHDLHKAFYNTLDSRVSDSLYQNGAGPCDSRNVRRQPHEIEPEINTDDIRFHGHDEKTRRRKFDKWSNYKQSPPQQKSPNAKERRHIKQLSEGSSNYSQREHRRLKSAPAPPFVSNDYIEDCYNLDTISAAEEASSKQKKTIDNYVARVIANADSNEYITPLPKTDSAKSKFCSDAPENENNHDVLPSHSFGEVDLLQRAIERRAILHDRIVKMEAASAEFARDEQERVLRKQSGTKDGKHKQRKSSGTKSKRAIVEETNDRMNEISERIKAEALEFLNFDHKDDGSSQASESNLTEEASNATRDASDSEGGLDPPEHVHVQQESYFLKQQIIIAQDQYEKIEDQSPTPQQLARYSNMVRLGIPDIVVLRSMEKDDIDALKGNSILDSLKHKHRIQVEENLVTDAASSDDLLKAKDRSKNETIENGLLSDEIPTSRRKDSLPPLKDDPAYNKYFKMLKAKVPLSWVKRVLEVDGKDARVLDLDPDIPLHQQVIGAGVDEYGNIDWDKVTIFRTDSDKSIESSGDELIGRSSNQRISTSSSPNIHLETTASVKAELAIMTAKAGRLSRDSSRQSSLSGLSIDAKEIKPNPTDIPSAAVTASNARLKRLEAITTSDRDSLLRRKQSVDEIRKRPPPPPPRIPNQQVPPSPSTNTVTTNERFIGTRKHTYEHLALKDDPRFSKYFQMIRSRVPRSWVERVIEVDDRDPAILDLDPNKPLAVQVDDDDSKSLIRTLTTETDGSFDESARIDTLDVTGISGSSDKDQVNKDPISSLTQEVPEDIPPQIVDAVNDDERSIASSITNFKDVSGSQIEQSNVVIDRISAFLDKIEAETKSNISDQTLGKMTDIQPSPSLSSQENVETKLTRLIKRLDSRGKQSRPQTEESQNGIIDETQHFIQKNQSDITKLSALLTSKLGQRSDANESYPSNDQSDLSKLSSLLGEVLAKMDEKSTSDEPSIEPAKKLGKNAALEALFAKRIALTKEREAPILRQDPEYEKYFKMQKLGVPRSVIEKALERDGKEISILELDPERPLVEQQEESTPKPAKNAGLEALFGNRAAALQPPKKNDKPLKHEPEVKLVSDEEGKLDIPIKDDPEYAKFFKMLKMGIPLGAVEQALQKEGKDRSIASMDPEKSYDKQIAKKEHANHDHAEVPLKDDPEYAKFFKMLKMGVPVPAVKQALQKEGKDPNIIEMDPEKPYTTEIPLIDHPEYSKFFKMLKMGVPPPAVKQALQKEGKDPGVIDMDPKKPLSQKQSKPDKVKEFSKIYNAPKVARKRLHWNKIDESKLNEKSFWNQAKDKHASLQLVGLDIDNEEFASLFTSQVNKTAAPKKDSVLDTKKSPGKQKVQLIDGRRRMNGSILLTKFKVDYKLLARQVNNMEYVKAEGNELRGMMQLLPTKDESLALRSYLPPIDAPQSEIDEAISKLGECEQYMAIMLDVPDAKEKFECMLFRAEFEQQVDSIRDGTKLLIDACDSVQNSERFKKLLMYALKLGNALNTDGSGAEATAITLDSLLKLAEAKAFDRQTSVLHYLVSIVSKNDEDVLKISEDFVPVKAAERIAVDMLSQQLKELTGGIKLIKKMAKRYAPQNESNDEDVENTPEDELLGATPMGKFSLGAESKISSLTKEFAEAKVNFSDLLEFFGEDANLTPEAFFCTINSFVSMFDQTYKELKRKEDAKERKKRIEEKRKLREEAAKGGA